ncbi:MAG: ABC transporter permease subunit [Treponema sp.]|jgi:putative aldouronate transport system permease protein|nr:ABC transporter permease subunit [Treponema sp.]
MTKRGAASGSGIHALGKTLYKQKYLQLMTLPGIVFLIIFSYIPMYGIVIAFKNYKITRTIAASPWIGFEYFKELFGVREFYGIIGNTLAISGLKLLAAFPLSILFALLLNEIRHSFFKRLVQTISYLPHFLSWVILSGIIIPWLSESGFLNEVLVLAGILKEPVGFLAFPRYFWFIAVLTEVWKETGWSAIIFIAAISGVDTQIYEAATIDGIGRFRRMWNITLPCISGTIAMIFVLNAGGLMGSNFDQIFILKNVLNAPRAEVIDTYVFETGIRHGRYSYAAAAGLFQSVTALLLLLTANTVSKKMRGDALF